MTVWWMCMFLLHNPLPSRWTPSICKHKITKPVTEFRKCTSAARSNGCMAIGEGEPVNTTKACCFPLGLRNQQVVAHVPCFLCTEATIIFVNHVMQVQAEQISKSRDKLRATMHKDYISSLQLTVQPKGWCEGNVTSWPMSAFQRNHCTTRSILRIP